MDKKNSIDKPFLFNFLALLFFGFFIFLSASLGLLTKDDVTYSSIALGQITIGLIGGGILAFIAAQIPYKFWRTYSFWIFIASIIATLLVFVPGIGIELFGAKRWISIGSHSFQPSEMLKIGYLIYLATWLSLAKDKIKTFKYGTLPFFVLSAIVASILFFQPDNDTILITLIAGAAMYFAAGASLRHVLLTIILGVILAGGIIYHRPYVMDRITSFLNPDQNLQSTSYQLNQSLIAIGSGGLTGRGFGQSIQKFDLLPEPIGDSIFAVAGEEFGFFGSIFIVLLFISFLVLSIRISLLSKESFGGLLMLGLAILIVSQSFINMASMLGIFPLSGLPLLFISHGGSAMFFTLFAVGIMLNISRYKIEK